MKAFLSILQILLSVGLMGVILLQHRKTGGFSGMFGGGTQADAGGGSWQRMNGLNKATVVLTALFMLFSLILVVLPS
ncbi:preprotein translocase subunit SecG [Aminomonas paucivorans]|uniref:preprotein translocase subunit SecG n=1 Tax=Aminomonas paucivorans TaxID=81412 RepID=UPI00331754C6